MPHLAELPDESWMDMYISVSNFLFFGDITNGNNRYIGL